MLAMGLGLNRVDQTVAKLNRDINDGPGIFGTGPKGLDAKEIKAFTKSLSKMSPQDADKVMNKLEQTGALDKFAKALMASPDQLRGMSVSDRQNLFATLAKKVDGQSLAALAYSLGGNAPSMGKAMDFLGELGGAIATHGTLQSKMEFMGSMIERSSVFQEIMNTLSPRQQAAAENTLPNGAGANNPATTQQGGAHTVARGDTLSEIAAANGTTVRTLMAANPHIRNADLIFPGQTIRIAGGNGQGGAGGAAGAGGAGGAQATQGTQGTGGATLNPNNLQLDARSVRAAELAEARALPGSRGLCYRYVKQALQQSGAVNTYLPGGSAIQAGPHLERQGYTNILNRPGFNIRSPYDAPPGAVLVYAGGQHGHIELRTRNGFASDYFSPRARTGGAGEGLDGRGRRLVGVYIKPAAGTSVDTVGANMRAGGTGRTQGAQSVGAPSASEQGRINQAMNFFMAQGWTRTQATGIVANLVGESRVRHDQAQIGGGPGYGLAQWEGPRQADFRRFAGHDIRQSTFQEQLNFIQHELTTSERGAGNRLRRATNVNDAVAIVTRYYERPADIVGDIAERQAIASRMR
jgi:LysM repeat protein